VAIDTENKRRSVAGYTTMPMLPVADAAIGALDRELVAWLYAGIPATSPPTPAAPFRDNPYLYDKATATGTIGAGIVQQPDVIYDD
jgi:hypothetical protein